MPMVEEERTGDIAHLAARWKYFAFYSLCQEQSSPFVRNEFHHPVCLSPVARLDTTPTYERLGRLPPSFARGILAWPCEQYARLPSPLFAPLALQTVH